MAREIPINIKPLAQDLIRGMIRDKVIKEVHSPTIFCARTSFIPKADGSSLRLVTNFCGLNHIICRPVWPLTLRIWRLK